MVIIIIINTNEMYLVYYSEYFLLIIEYKRVFYCKYFIGNYLSLILKLTVYISCNKMS